MPVLECKQDTPVTRKPSPPISFKNILYATDFSPTSESALPYATGIWRHFGGTLHVAHILSDANLVLMAGGVDYMSVNTVYEDAQDGAKEKIEQITSRLGRISCRSHLRRGPVWANLGGIVEENKIDLIVVGTHGRTGLGKVLLGSVAEDILRHAPCPVLTVGPGVHGRAKMPNVYGKGTDLAPVQLELHNILYATNFAPASLMVAPLAVSLAEEFRSRLTLMSVLENYASLGAGPGPIEDGVRRLQELVPTRNGLAYMPEFLMDFGAPSECIVNAAAKHEADMIVLAAHAADGITRVPWSTVHRVVANATCPVMTVRGS
jgi:nucleotide-binding universal stress UspA family protein